MSSNKDNPVCIPSVLGPMIVCFIFPPLFVFLHELKKNPPFQKPQQIFLNMILTSALYFPGLIHGLSLIRTEGTWTDNYSGGGL